MVVRYFILFFLMPLKLYLSVRRGLEKVQNAGCWRALKIESKEEEVEMEKYNF